MVGKSLTSKILILILLASLVGIGLVVGYFLMAQNRDLVQERETAAEQQTEILYESIRSNMLVGTAPIARQLLRDLQDLQSIREVALFRADGKEAFTDNETIQIVNQLVGEEMFELSEVRDDYRTDQSHLFQTAVHTQAQQIETYATDDGRELVYYVPLFSDPECASCHDPALSPDSDVRGVVRVTTSLGDVDRRVRQNTAVSIGIWITIVAILTISIILSMERMVLEPIKNIGEVAEEVERGNLDAQVAVRSQDEIGYLGKQINRMIVGLNERLKLTKFVSQATLEEVVSGSDLALGGEKRNLTVLFSDIRGFTAYSERHDAQEVIETLNVYMQRQAGIIIKAGGDVDQFVGDEVLGVFRAETMAEDAVWAALDIIAAIDSLNAAHELDIHVGVGIHTGMMIEGNIGTQDGVDRLQRTVIGDTVNTGARICSAAAPAEVLVSQATYDLIKEKAVVDEARTIQVKGKREPLTVYPVRGFRARPAH